MKTLIATLSISAALLAPVASFAATTTQPTAMPNTSTTVAATTAPSHDTMDASHVAMNKQAETSFGKQASDDRAGLSRVQEQSRQLGATN